MKQNFMKRLKYANKGITLIALVITIIVLLILAAVSISTLTGENGLLTKASDAKDKTTEAEVKEDVGLAWNSVQTDGIIENWDLNKKATELQAELQKKDSSATVTVDGNNLKVSYRSYEVTINTEDGTIDLAKSSVTIDKFLISGTRVTPPEVSGFTHIGTDDVDEGYTIKDANDNEFVWIPVDKNQTIKIKVTSEETIESIVLTNPVGEEKTVGNESGKEYEIDPSSFTKTYNGVYRLIVTTEGGETVKRFLSVHSLYAIDTQNDWYYGNDATDEELLKDKFGDCFEPSDTIDYVAKVAANGGFYVGKYEATYRVIDGAEKAGSIPSTSTRKNSSTTLTNGMLWNFIPQKVDSGTDAIGVAKAFNTSVNSSLLTGAAWDRILGWLYETGEKTGSEIAVDSKEWGNYKNDSFSGTTGLINTGAFEQTKANNIYDLAGNVYEWTTEAYDTSSRVSRGGDYYNLGSGGPASCRFSNRPVLSYIFIGFRLALYL